MSQETSTILAALILGAAWVLSSLIEKGLLTMAALDDKIAALKDAVAADETVHGSVKTLISGFAKRLSDAVAAASTAGATDAQLAEIQAVIDSIKAGTDDLTKAVTENTTPAVTPTVAPVAPPA